MEVLRIWRNCRNEVVVDLDGDRNLFFGPLGEHSDERTSDSIPPFGMTEAEYQEMQSQAQAWARDNLQVPECEKGPRSTLNVLHRRISHYRDSGDVYGIKAHRRIVDSAGASLAELDAAIHASGLDNPDWADLPISPARIEWLKLA